MYICRPFQYDCYGVPIMKAVRKSVMADTLVGCLYEFWFHCSGLLIRWSSTGEQMFAGQYQKNRLAE